MAIFTIQQTVKTTASALPAYNANRGVFFSAPASNIANIYIGGTGITTSTGYPLAPGYTLFFDGLATTNGLFVVGSNTTDSISGIIY